MNQNNYDKVVDGNRGGIEYILITYYYCQLLLRLLANHNSLRAVGQ